MYMYTDIYIYIDNKLLKFHNSYTNNKSKIFNTYNSITELKCNKIILEKRKLKSKMNITTIVTNNLTIFYLYTYTHTHTHTHNAFYVVSS